jgi:mannan endo-1,4-beta-mannosidase
MTFEGVQAKVYTERNTNKGIVGISVDGGAEKLVDAYGKSRSDQQLLFATPVLASGSHTIRVRNTGTRNSSSSSTYAVADRIDVLSSPAGAVATLNDATAGPAVNQFNYQGTWSTSTPVGTLNGDNHYNSITGTSYQIQFSGTRAKIFSERSSALGIVGISVDGGAETLVDAYSAARLEQQLLYTSPVLTKGSHVLTVRNTGTKNPSSSGIYAVADRVDFQG